MKDEKQKKIEEDVEKAEEKFSKQVKNGNNNLPLEEEIKKLEDF